MDLGQLVEPPQVNVTGGYCERMFVSYVTNQVGQCRGMARLNGTIVENFRPRHVK